MAGSVYIHIPFCSAKCAYCDFFSIPADSASMERFVIALRREIQNRAGGEVETVYVGGGTPSVLPPGSLGGILECLGEHCLLAQGAEVTVEANPESITPLLLKELVDAGVTRLSVGVQSFDEGELRLLGRPHGTKEAREALGAVSSIGVLDFSIDLMYSIPGQDIEGWRDTLSTALSFGPSHISAYELTPEPGTPLEGLLNSGKLCMPPEDTALSMYQEAVAVLGRAGLEHYEVSNYARSGKRSRHNLNYWKRGEYLGLGPGAVSFLSGLRTRNMPDVKAYIEAIEAGLMPPTESERPGPEEASREFLMLGLRTSEGVSLAEAADAYGIRNLSEAASMLVSEGLMAVENDRMFLSEGGMPLMNSVLTSLFDSLGI